MIQTIRQIKSRIKSVENTKKITRAMEMISASKLNKARSLLHSYRQYHDALESMLKEVLSCAGEAVEHPFLADRAVKKSVILFVAGSDTGLCGAYNNAVIVAAEKAAIEIGPDKVRFVIIGKEIYRHFIKKGYAVTGYYPNTYGRYSDEIPQQIAADLADSFLTGSADGVYAVYTHFISGLKMKPTVEKVLSIDIEYTPRQNDFILEPDLSSIIEKMVPLYFNSKIKSTVISAFTSEHSARMMAMSAATDNADDLIDTLTLIRNKSRQAAITKEVLEIAMSAEALKG